MQLQKLDSAHREEQEDVNILYTEQKQPLNSRKTTKNNVKVCPVYTFRKLI